MPVFFLLDILVMTCHTHLHNTLTLSLSNSHNCPYDVKVEENVKEQLTLTILKNMHEVLNKHLCTENLTISEYLTVINRS